MNDSQLAIIVSSASVFVTLVGTLFVYYQVSLHRKQTRFDALLKISEINRQLLMLGFDHPDLFQILTADGTDSEEKSRYIQLWINQCDVIYHAKNLGLLSREHVLAFEQDMSSFFAREDILRHWTTVENYYPPGLRQYIGKLLRLHRESTN